jgi:hypothetical protein
MKRRFVFVGSLPSHMMGVVSFREFGQAVELTAEQARDLALGGAAIVPEEDFEKLGFQGAELAKFGPFGSHANAPAEFATKKAAAIAAYDRFRQSLETVVEEGK